MALTQVPGSQAQHIVLYSNDAGTSLQTVSPSNPLPVNASVSASITGFSPGGTYATLSVSSVSSNVLLPTGSVVLVTNDGSTTAYVNLGTSNTVTATTSQLVVEPGATVSLTPGSNTYLAGITASSTTTLKLAGGSGLYTGVGGTGSGGGSGGNVNLTQVGGTNISLGQTTMTGSLPVVIASDQTSHPVSISQTTPGTTNAVDVTNLPVTVDVNTGNATNSTPRVVLASNQPTLTATANQGTPATQTAANAWPVIQPDSATQTGTITLNGDTVTLSTTHGGYGTFGVQVTGTWSGAIIVQGSVDGTNFTPTTLLPLANGTASTNVTSNGAYQGNMAGLKAVQLKGLSMASGTANITISGGQGVSAVMQDNSPWSVAGNIASGSSASGINPVMVGGTDGTNVRSMSVDSSGHPTVVGTGTFAVQLTGSTNNINNISGTISLPTGAATSALQTTGNTSLSTIASGYGATGSTVPADGVYGGLLAKTSNPSAATDGNLVGSMADKLGRQVVVIGNVRDNKGNQYTTLSSSSETTVVTAVASTFLDVYGCIAANTTASAVTLVFKDSTAGTTQFEFEVPASETRGFMLPSSDAFKQTTVNNNWTCTGGASGVNISMLYVKNI